MATAQGIRDITGTTLADAALSPFITASDCIIQQVQSCALSKGITQACIDVASNWVASHLLSVSGIDDQSRVMKMEKFEGYSVSWAMSEVKGQNLMSTTFGQAANAMLGGCLDNVGRRTAAVGFAG